MLKIFKPEGRKANGTNKEVFKVENNTGEKKAATIKSDVLAPLSDATDIESAIG